MCLCMRWLGGAVYFFLSLASAIIDRFLKFSKEDGGGGQHVINFGQTQVGQHESAYMPLIIGSKVLTLRKPYAGKLLVMSNLTLKPPFKV